MTEESIINSLVVHRNNKELKSINFKDKIDYE